MNIIEIKDLSKHLNYELGQYDNSLSCSKLLTVGKIEYRQIFYNYNFQEKFIKIHLNNLKSLNYKVGCIIKRPECVVMKPRSLGYSNIYSFKKLWDEFYFIKDKNIDEVIDIFKQIIDLKVFL